MSMDKDKFDLSKYDLTSFLVQIPPPATVTGSNPFFCPPPPSCNAQKNCIYPPQSQLQFNNNNHRNSFYPEEYSQNDNVTYTSATLSSRQKPRSNNQSCTKSKSAAEIKPFRQNIVSHRHRHQHHNRNHNQNNLYQYQLDDDLTPPFRPQSISNQNICQLPPPVNNFPFQYRQFNFANFTNLGEEPVQIIRRRRASADNELFFNNEDSFIGQPSKRHKIKKSPVKVKFITSREGDEEEREIDQSQSIAKEQEESDQQFHIEKYGVGSKMLLKMGFKPGHGLGKHRQGIKVPIEPKVKNDRKPIG